MNDQERAIALFEERGEAWVRQEFERERFTPFEARLANHWLSERERASYADRESESARAAHLSAAAAERSAAATERQAHAAVEANAIAKTANTIATIAIIMAVLAMAVSIIGIFLKLD